MNEPGGLGPAVLIAIAVGAMVLAVEVVRVIVWMTIAAITLVQA